MVIILWRSVLLRNYTDSDNINSLRDGLSNGNSTNFYLLTNQNNGDTGSVTFEFVNNDIDNTLIFKFLSTSLNLECKYNSSFDVNKDFNIYLTSDMDGEKVYIVSFDITEISQSYILYIHTKTIINNPFYIL